MYYREAGAEVVLWVHISTYLNGAWA